MKVNGTVEIRLLCLSPDCHFLIGGQKHADHPDRDQYHVVVDNRGQNPACARCGDQDTEEHHWSPKAIFGEVEAEKWPTGYYCVGCHVFWHRRMAR